MNMDLVESDEVSSDESSSSEDENIDHTMQEELPVFRYKKELIEAIRGNQVVIINGKTGCGKSTQLPQYILEANLANQRTIVLTQPRRMAAINIAKRIARERRSPLGKEVGYHIRFDSKWSSSTKIKVVTEGILLNEAQSDKKLNDYGVIIADEVHERSINSDMLLGILKKITEKRKDLKIIICSATINSQKFSTYFNDAAVVRIEGRRYPIEVVYAKHAVKEKYGVEESVKCVKRILEKKDGDILIFFPGEIEILECCQELEDLPNVVLFPLYAAIGIGAQNKVFKPVQDHETKIVVATNIAETSITINGIKYVIDSGYVKESGYKGHFDLQTLDNVLVSKAQADQRKGRAGRTGPGVCYRLYRQKDYKGFDDEPKPEILRESLYEMYLKLIVFGFKPNDFLYMDSPTEENLDYARKELQNLSLIDGDEKLTVLGKSVSDLPIDPRLGKVIFTSGGKVSAFEILCVAAMLTERHIFQRPWKERALAEERQRKFDDADGDHFSFLNLYREWKEERSQGKWCRRYFVNIHIMKEVDLIVQQLSMILRRNNLPITTRICGNKAEIKSAFLSVFFRNISFVLCYNFEWRAIKLLDEQYFRILPGSSFKRVIEADLSSETNVQAPQICMFCQAFQIKRKFCNQTMRLDLTLMEGFEEELKIIGFWEKIKNPESIL